MNDKASAGFDKAASKLSRLSGKMTSMGQSMTRNVTLPIVGIGVAAVKMASDLDRSMRNVQSVGRQTEEELAALSKTFVDMSTDITQTTDSALNLADAFFNIQGSGFEGADAMTVLEAASKAASAGLTETGIAAEGITAVINSYGKSASEAEIISDLMFRTVDRGVGSFEQLTSSMSGVVGTASTIGVSFEEVSAAIATMSKQGISFNQASVSLNQALLGFLKPTDAMSAAIAKAGFESGLAMIETLGFAGAMEELADQTGGQADQMAGLFGSVRGLRAALALTGAGAEIFAEDLAAMGEAAGATAEAFAIQTQSFNAQWKIFKNTLSALLIEVGQVIIPVLAEFMQKVLIPMIQAFRNLPDGVKTFIIALAGIAAAIGPLLFIGGKLLALFSSIKLAVAALSTALPAVGAAIAAVSLPVVAVIAGIAALGVALFLLVKNWDKVSAVIRKFMIALGRLIVEGLGGGIVKMFNLGKNLIGALINGLKSKIKELISTALRIATDVNKAITNAFGIKSPSKVMIRTGLQITQGLNNGLTAGFQVVNQNTKEFATEMMSILTRGDFLGTGAFAEDSPVSVTLFKMREDMVRTGQAWNLTAREMAATGQRSIAIIAQAQQAAMVQTATLLSRIRGATSRGQPLNLPNVSSAFQQIATQTNAQAQQFGAGSQLPGYVSGRGGSGYVSGGGGGYVSGRGGSGYVSGFQVGTMNINVPPGTTREQMDAFMQAVGKEAKRRGARGF